jgi:SEL1 protein
MLRCVSVYLPFLSIQTDIVEYYKLNAERGDHHSQVVLGQLFLTGSEGVQQDYNEAFRFLQMVAVQSLLGFDDGQAVKDGKSAESMAYLGEMYRLGRGVDVDYKLANDWYEKAATRKSWLGSHGLGVLHLNGYGVPRSEAKALAVACLG